MAKILIIAKGGFGDVMPVWAIMAELQRRGHDLKVAAEQHHAPACQAHAIEHIQLPHKAGPFVAADDAEIEALLPQARDADLLLGNQLAPSAAILSHLTRTPWIYGVASPLAIPSRLDPPQWPYLHHAQGLLPNSALWQQGAFGLVRMASRLALRTQQRQRRRYGLADGAHPRFEAFYSPWLNLMMTTPELVPPQPDWPANTLVTGFCAYEPSFLGNEKELDALERFAEQDAPPVVIAPGGMDRARPEGFIASSLEACKALDLRAIFVLSPRFHHLIPDEARFFSTGYLPYSRLIKPARALVHSGGIGALGWALRAGKPSLIIPSSWDHYDNARRAVARGVALSLRAGAGSHRMVQTLKVLIESPWPHLQAISSAVATEQGACTAADAIEAKLKDSDYRKPDATSNLNGIG